MHATQEIVQPELLVLILWRFKLGLCLYYLL
jgi:hypothetical protein